MIKIGKTAAMLALSLLLVQNTAMAACNCGQKNNPSRNVSYKPYKDGKYAKYYSSLSHYYTHFAHKLSSKGNKEGASYFFSKSQKAQQGNIRVEMPPRGSSDYGELDNARKLLIKNSTKKNMGMYPRELAAAHFYYDAWAVSAKYGITCPSSRTSFYKYINLVITKTNHNPDALSISQSKHLERYFTDHNLVGTIYFPFDNYTKILNTDKKAIVDEARASVSSNHVLVVVGNADRVGAQGYNIDLSVKRAKTVRDLLVANGIEVDGIEIVAFGKNRVSEAYGTETYSNSANRRVEIYAVKKPSPGCASK